MAIIWNSFLKMEGLKNREDMVAALLLFIAIVFSFGSILYSVFYGYFIPVVSAKLLVSLTKGVLVTPFWSCLVR